MPRTGWWVMRDSNSRHLRCKRSALPAELITPTSVSDRQASCAPQGASHVPHANQLKQPGIYVGSDRTAPGLRERNILTGSPLWNRRRTHRRTPPSSASAVFGFIASSVLIAPASSRAVPADGLPSAPLPGRDAAAAGPTTERFLNQTCRSLTPFPLPGLPVKIGSEACHLGNVDSPLAIITGVEIKIGSLDLRDQSVSNPIGMVCLADPACLTARDEPDPCRDAARAVRSGRRKPRCAANEASSPHG